MSSSAADNAYRQARELIDRGRYERALEQLDRMIGRYPNTIANRVDAALYWKAYAEAKLAQRTEALATLADMQKRFADSRWLRDARALELEIRQASGQAISPEAQADEELKLLALRGLMQSDPDRALPMVEQILSGNSSVRVKERALFVLSQSRAPRARDIVVGVAKSADNPDVQLRAIRYLGAMRSSDNRQILNEIYRSSNDQAVKRAIIQSLISSEAVDQLTEIAKTEKDVQLRRSAIRRLGSMDRARTGELLRALYASDASPEGRREIINALSSQENAPVLVALARAEKDPALKRDIVARLSTMKSKEATDYLLELLK